MTRILALACLTACLARTARAEEAVPTNQPVAPNPAVPEETTEETAPPPKEASLPKPQSPRTSPHELAAGFNLSFLNLPLPLAYGPSVSWRYSRDWTFEASYTMAGIGSSLWFTNVAGFNETLISLDARRYTGSGFNWILGVSRRTFEATLGEDYIARAISEKGTSQVLFVETLNLDFGLGNQWRWKNWLAGVDWFVINVPVVRLRAEAPLLEAAAGKSDRSVIDDILNVLRWLPTGTIGKLYLGYAF